MSSPLVLAVESSAARSSIAVLNGEELLSEREFARGSGGRGSGSPAAAAAEALEEAGLSPKEVQLVAASVGPGSYTGLRVGISFAKCFAWATSAQTVAVPSLQALAKEVRASAENAVNGLLVPTADAFRKQIYARAFRTAEDGNLEPLCEDLVLPPAELPRKLEELSANAELLAFGSGAEKYSQLLLETAAEAKLKLRIQPKPLYPSAATVGRVALKIFEAGKTVTAHELVPVYLRKTEAEERLEIGTAK